MPATFLIKNNLSRFIIVGTAFLLWSLSASFVSAHLPHDLSGGPYSLDGSDHAWSGLFVSWCSPASHGTIEQILASGNAQPFAGSSNAQVLDVFSKGSDNYCASAATDIILPSLSNATLNLFAAVDGNNQFGEDFWFYIYDYGGTKRYERYFPDDERSGTVQFDITGVSLPAGTYIFGFTAGPDGTTEDDYRGTQYGGSVHFKSIELRDIPKPTCTITAPSSVTQNAVFNFSWSSNNATHIALNYTGNTVFTSAGEPIPQTGDMGSSINGSADLKISASSGTTDIALCVDSTGTNGTFSDCLNRNHTVCSKTITVTPAAAPTCTMSVNGSPASANQSFTYTPGTAFNLTFNTANSTHGIYSLSGNSTYGGSHVSGESPIPSYGDLGTWPATAQSSTGPFHIDASSGSTVLGITVDYSGTRSSSCSVVFNAPSGPSFRVQPTSATLSLGNTQQYQAYYDADGSGPQSEQLVTTSASWSSANSSIAAVNNASQKGLATAAAGGSTQITASYTALSDSGGITVNVPQPTFVIAPASATINVGASQQFIGWYDPDGPGGSQAQQDQTNNASWSSSNNSVATVTNFSPKGRADGVSSGSITITAVYSGITATANLGVASAPTHLQCVSNTCTKVSGSGSDGCSPEGSSCGGGGNGGGGGCCGAGGSGPTGASAAAPDCGKALVQWSDTSNDEEGFKVERASNQNGPWTEVGSVGANVMQFLDQNISPSAKYFWRVYAFKGNAVSSYSSTISADITACLLAPLAPSDLQGQAAGCNAITLNWKDNADNEAGFWVERKSPGDSDFSVIAAPIAASPGTGSIAAYTDASVSNGLLYDYRVSAFNASGFSAATSLTGILNPYPAVDFSYSPVPLLHGKIANFANLGQTFGGTTIAGSLWTFQNGKPTQSIKTNAQTVFQTPGTKTVALKVTDSQGRACTAAKNIAVSQNPDATFEEIPPE